MAQCLFYSFTHKLNSGPEVLSFDETKLFFSRHASLWTTPMLAISALIMRPISVTIATGLQSNQSCTV